MVKSVFKKEVKNQGIEFLILKQWADIKQLALCFVLQHLLWWVLRMRKQRQPSSVLKYPQQQHTEAHSVCDSQSSLHSCTHHSSKASRKEKDWAAQSRWFWARSDGTWVFHTSVTQITSKNRELSGVLEKKMKAFSCFQVRLPAKNLPQTTMKFFEKHNLSCYLSLPH